MEPGVPILMYHKVAPLNKLSKTPGHYVHPRMFDRHMALLRALGFVSTPVENLFSAGQGRRRIAITFDDGYRNFFQHAMPALQRYGMNGTVFLVSGQIGGRNEWDIKLGDVEEPLMDQVEIRDAQRAGIAFGSHTRDHVNLSRVDEATAWDQINVSREQLQHILEMPVTSFCYPYGARTPAVEQLVRKAGYVVACATDKGVNTSSADRFALRRINVRRDTSVPVLAIKLWRGLKLGK